MREHEVRVTFQPLGKTIYVLRGTRLQEAAAGAGVTLDMPCGGEGKCGKCRVIVRSGECEPTPTEREHFDQDELDQGLRLGCQSRVCGSTTVEVPETSLLASSHKILARSQHTSHAVVDPAIRKRYVELSKPERGSDEPDLARLEDVVGPLQADLEVLRRIPALLREAAFRGTAVMAGRRLIDFEPGNTEKECFAVAVDLGTTTLVAELVDLTVGEPVAVASRLNPQTRFGDDVLSRIRHSRESAEGLQDLHEAVVEAVDEMIGELVGQASVARERIYEVTVSGNTTMQQFLCRLDPRWLGEVPFVPATQGPVVDGAARLGLRIHPRGRIYVMPVIGGFVGGDTVSGILATGLADRIAPTLLVDIGTNGEIVLLADGNLQAASTAAGPAFEGARISQGMRACTGAIEKVIVNRELRINVIGDVAPVGLCGSALIDVGAELLRHKVLTPEGRLLLPDELPADLPDDLRGRIVASDGQVSFLLVTGAESGTGKPIAVTQRDFRELQLATGAFRAGITILLRRAGLRPEDLDSVLVAGGFGNFIRRSNAQRIGLLPPEIARNRILYQGNTSLAGARLVAVSTQMREVAEAVARRTEHVDLSRDPEFATTFAEAMLFPAGSSMQ